MLQKWAFNYADAHRAELAKCKTIDDLISAMPSDYQILRDFVEFAYQNGIPRQWAYINPAADLIVSRLKALVARDALGIPGYYMIDNRHDVTVQEALKQLSGEEKTSN